MLQLVRRLFLIPYIIKTSINRILSFSLSVDLMMKEKIESAKKIRCCNCSMIIWVKLKSL
jgi:hypothetical protein